MYQRSIEDGTPRIGAHTALFNVCELGNLKWELVQLSY